MENVTVVIGNCMTSDPNAWVILEAARYDIGLRLNKAIDKLNEAKKNLVQAEADVTFGIAIPVLAEVGAPEDIIHNEVRNITSARSRVKELKEEIKILETRRDILKKAYDLARKMQNEV